MKQSSKFHGPARKAASLIASAGFLAALATTGWTTNAHAAQCLNEAFGGNTNCTANDVRIASITVGAIIESCDGSIGDTFTFDGNLNVTAGATRYDIGFYIGEDPQLSTEDDCAVVIIPPGVSNLDNDACGDAPSGNLVVPVSGLTAPCQDSDGDGFFDVQACSSWDQNAGPGCNSPEDAVPGTSSKCLCESVPTDEPVPNCTNTPGLCEDNNICTDDICDPPNGDFFGCRHVNNSAPCDDGLFCNGVDNCAAGGCNGHAGDPCAGGGVCGDLCNETTDSCFDAPGTVCRASAGVCDTQETCTGTSGACPTDDFLEGVECRASGGVCDPAEVCSGSAAACPANAFEDTDTVCRGSSGVCDVEETCTGSTAACPADDFVNEGTVCRASGGICDIAEECTGAAGACPDDDFVSSETVCRASGGVCDVAENCTGAAAACPADDFVDAGTTCRESAGVCDVAETCTGAAAACPDQDFVNEGTVCRSAAGVCDVAESCTGESAACPGDVFATTQCRASGGVCDIAENCTGSAAACPADQFVASTTVCRADAGQCDVAENCTGSSATCPNNGFEPEGTQCALDENPCTDDQCNASGTCVAIGNAESCDDGLFCNGTDTCVDGACTGHSGDPCAGGGICGDNCQEDTDSCFDSASTVCRPSGGVCDVAENCTGSSGACPTDQFVSSATTCRSSGGICDIAENCTGSSATCPTNQFVSSATTCRSSSGVCDTAERCTGNTATCPTDTFLNSTTVCRADAGDCDVAERCTGNSGACPAQGFEPAGTACTTDNNVCTNDVCNANGVCQHTNNTIPCDDGQFCTVGDQCTGGECEGDPRDCSDDFECTTEVCNENTNSCQVTPDNEECADDDICTTDICDVDVGCRNIFSCKDICRRFGFWGKRGGDGEETINVVQTLLDVYGGIEVCGELIDETTINDSVAGLGLSSALEGLCVRPQGVEQRTLYRELVTTALNCAMSGAAGEDFCDTVVQRYVDVTFSECNDLCEGETSSESAEDCIQQLDCYNSGGQMIGNKCAYGNCDVTGELCGGDYGPCPPFASIPIPLLQVCERFDGNCRDEEFCQEGLGVCPERLRTTSGRACKEAKNNDCAIDFCSIDED